MIQVNKDLKLKDVTNVVNEKSPSFSGIVNQESKGKLWVDNIENPRIAIAESYAVGSFAFLGSNETKEDLLNLKDFLENEFLTDLKKNGYDCFEFSVEGENLRRQLLEIFKDRAIQTEREFSFRMNEVLKMKEVPKMNESPKMYHVLQISHVIPKEYQLRKVDDTFWNMLIEGNFTNADFLKTRLLESWDSFEEFQKKSKAYCVTIQNRIVAVMVGTASYNHVIAIDIETEEEHRRKGLAYAMAAEFITDSLENHLIPQWDCVESNPTSYHMAEKLGFERFCENTVYWFCI